MGFLTAILAFGIVRLEQWLFDIKEGFCKDGWYKAKRFCCPVLGPGRVQHHLLEQTYANVTLANPWPNYSTTSLNGNNEILPCMDWVSWAEWFGLTEETEEWIVEYAVYSGFAVCFSPVLYLSIFSLTNNIRSYSSHSFPRFSLSNSQHRHPFTQVQIRAPPSPLSKAPSRLLIRVRHQYQQRQGQEKCCIL